LRGYFFRAPDAVSGERRPLVIMNNGSDGATSAMWGHSGSAAVTVEATDEVPSALMAKRDSHVLRGHRRLRDSPAPRWTAPARSSGGLVRQEKVAVETKEVVGAEFG
jgi:hypothetical protein